MKIANILWQANIAAEYAHQDNPKFKKQLDEVLERGIPYMVVFGQDELDQGIVKVKDMRAHTEVQLPRNDLIQALQTIGCCPLTSAIGSAEMLFFDQLKSVASGATKLTV